MAADEAAPAVPTLARAPIHIGPSSWTFEGWKGTFYPEGTPPGARLAWVVTQFDTVEVNMSFHALPRPSMLVDWVEVAPASFTYALKTPRRITHELKLLHAEGAMGEFLEVVLSLGPAAAPALLQLPPDFTRARSGRTLATFLDWLAPRLQGVRLAVEVRAADLMTAAFAGFLAERGMALAIVDRTHNPQIDLHAIWLEALTTRDAPPFAYLRWIGDDVKYREVDHEIVDPRPEEIALWASRLAHLSRLGVECFGYVHNPYEGHSPATLRRLRARLLEAGAPVFAPGNPAGQLTLF